MQPFSYIEKFNDFKKQYPSVNDLTSIAKDASHKERIGIIRLWFTEGIPYAFKNCPILYEFVREWLGSRLSIHPKTITLIGSGRIGYSLASPPNLGAPFNNNSDLDFSIISSDMFTKCAKVFELWRGDYTNKIVSPGNSKQEFFWKNNLENLPKNILRGFIDSYKIPTLDRYEIIQNIEQTCWMLNKKLKITENAPVVRKISIRIYKNWQSFIRQLTINFSRAIPIDK